MRRITSLQGSAIVRYSTDDAASNTSVLTRDLVAFVAHRYQFSGVPEVPPGLILSQPFIFQAGEIVINERKIPINQLTHTAGTLFFTAKDTDTADLIAAQMIAEVDSEFGFRIGENIIGRRYLSALVVEFSPSIEDTLSAFSRITKILNDNLRTDRAAHLRRLAFGSGDTQARAQATGLFSYDDIPNLDFVIERRADESPERNRYHSTAPLSTADHERVLLLVEQALRD